VGGVPELSEMEDSAVEDLPSIEFFRAEVFFRTGTPLGQVH